MDTHELAWAAGFFDGEGGTYPSGRHIELVVVQKDTRQLERFMRAVDAGSICRGSLKQPIHRWRIAGIKNAIKVMTLLWPYIGEPKREQWASAMRKWGTS